MAIKRITPNKIHPVVLSLQEKKIKKYFGYIKNSIIFVVQLINIHMKFKSRAQAKRETGINYLGSVSMTTKHIKSKNYNELTYSLYLAPAKLSGYEVCPMRTDECTELCLNESGMNRMNMRDDMITRGRIKKTKLFFENREYFMDWMIEEIKAAKSKALKLGYIFSVRLNNTSDISPESFYKDMDGTKKNILQIFPTVMFYDYTKVPKRYELVKKYTNYDLTFSFSGLNTDECITMLNNDIRVAVVFRNKLPDTFLGREVIDGDLYDMRYKDKGGIIIGLKYKTTRKRPDKDSKFVVSL